DTFVQRIGQPILEAAGALLPLSRILDPVAAMRDIGPGTDVRDARHQRIYIAVDPVKARHLPGNPCGRKPLLRSGKMQEAMGEQPRMAFGDDLAKIGDLAHLPQQSNRTRMRSQFADLAIAGEGPESAVVVRLAGLDEPRYGWRFLKAL